MSSGWEKESFPQEFVPKDQQQSGNSESCDQFQDCISISPLQEISTHKCAVKKLARLFSFTE